MFAKEKLSKISKKHRDEYYQRAKREFDQKRNGDGAQAEDQIKSWAHEAEIFDTVIMFDFMLYLKQRNNQNQSNDDDKTLSNI